MEPGAWRRIQLRPDEVGGEEDHPHELDCLFFVCFGLFFLLPPTRGSSKGGDGSLCLAPEKGTQGTCGALWKPRALQGIFLCPLWGALTPEEH